jgi:hypothetical protein
MTEMDKRKTGFDPDNKTALMFLDGRPMCYVVSGVDKRIPFKRLYDATMQTYEQMLEDIQTTFYTPTGRKRLHTLVSLPQAIIEVPRSLFGDSYPVEWKLRQDDLDRAYGFYKDGRNWSRAYSTRSRRIKRRLYDDDI